MSGKEIDRQRWLAGTGWAVLLLIALVAAGGAALLLKR
jgi:hypothetical protein